MAAGLLVGDLQRLLESIVRETADAMGAFSAIALVSPDGRTVDPMVAYDADTEALAIMRATFAEVPLPVDHGLMPQVLGKGETVHLPQLSHEQLLARVGPAHIEKATSLDIKSVVLVPLRVDERPIGYMSLARHGPGAPPITPTELRLVRALAGQAALAIANARLDGERERMANRLRLVGDVAREWAAATEDYPRLLELVAHRLGELIGECAVVRIVNDEGTALEGPPGCFYHPDPELNALGRDNLAKLPQRLGAGMSGRVAASGQSLLLPVVDPALIVASVSTEHREFTARLGIRSVLAVPMLVSGKVVGVISLGRSRAGDPYTADDQAMLEDLAAHAALALSNSRLFDSLTRAEEQLRQQQKLEAIGRLAGGVAHDFNNLLSVVLSCTSILMREAAPGSGTRAELEQIQLAGERAADLTRQLLAFSRQQIIEPRIVDLNETVHALDQMIRRVIREDIRLDTRIEPGLARVKVDPGQIEQVILNLVLNARDAMPDGGTLTLETSNVTLGEAYARAHAGVTAGPHVMLAVSDTGSGMDRATRERIFEPFFTTKELGKGTGLGLSTVFGIVKQAGGSVFVYSEPGRGTSFKIYLPVTEEQERSARRSMPVVTTQGSETILLVEDDDQLRRVAHRVLARSGYTVLEARSGPDALATAAEHAGAIHLLLTDVVMPLMAGPELARRLRAVRPETPALYMSGYTQNAIVHQQVLEPGVQLLQKPITPDSLLRRVREVLDAPSA